MHVNCEVNTLCFVYFYDNFISTTGVDLIILCLVRDKERKRK